MPLKRARRSSNNARGSHSSSKSPDSKHPGDRSAHRNITTIASLPSPRTRGPVLEKTAIQNRPIMKEMEDSFEDDFPKGLTGLRNLINTCYFNAAVQVLSNCPPFSDFFRDKGDLRPYAVAEPVVSQLLAQLIQRIWSPRRESAVEPSALLSAVREQFVQFRGWSQQDSQELIRCLLELVHRELGQPVYAYEDYTSNLHKPRRIRTSTCSGDNEQFETADSGWSSDGDSPSTSNEQLERRYGEDIGFDSSKRVEPVSWRSIVTEVFDGSIESSVTCLTCKNVSTTTETFQDLSLPIPSREQLDKLTEVLEEDTNSNFYQERNRNTSWWSWLSSLFVSPPITLQDCLGAFFSPDRLVGDDMYSCEKCKKLRNGVKTCRISRAPEVLCVHIKRFRHDAFSSSKVSTKIDFPLVDLDISPFCTEGVSAEYDLCGFITHEGSGVDSGHYLAYCRNEIDGNWYEYDDATVTKLDSAYVLTKEAYVLIYQKKSTPMIEEVRNNVAAKISPESTVKIFTHSYISTEWLSRLNTFTEPGPVTNFTFLCSHGHIMPRRANHIGHLCTQVSAQLAEELFETFGGGPRVDELHYCLVCNKRWMWLSQKRKTELILYKEINDKLRSAYCKDDRELLYEHYFGPLVISRTWFQSWERFLTNPCAEPPGPIDNTPLLTKNGDHVTLKHTSNYIRIARELFVILQKCYGGGPEVLLVTNQPPEDEFRAMIEQADAAIREAQQRRDKLANESSEPVVVEPEEEENFSSSL